MWPFRRESRLSTDALATLQRLRAVPEAKEQFAGVVRLLLAEHPPCEAAMAEGPPPSKRLTEEQNVLISVALLDHHVENGGLLQLFWNCPARLGHVAHSLRTISLEGLANDFDRAVEQLGERFKDYERLRQHHDTVQAYVDAAQIFDFEWFDDRYLGDYEDGKLVKPGADQGVYDAALKYVYANMNGFVLPSGGRA